MNSILTCPVCEKSKKLFSLQWGYYDVIHCSNCELDFCAEMAKKEIGGDSSPVDFKGITMMSEMFHRTSKLAMFFATKRKKIYESYLNRICNNVLEVGCGPGVFYKSWAQLEVEWTGVDINPYWVKFGRSNGVPVSSEPIDSIIDKYDVIMAHQVIEHVEDPIKFMNTLKGLLNPGGIIHLELPNQNSFTARLRKISSALSYDYGFIQPPMHLRAYSKNTINYLFRSLNLESKMVFVCGNTDPIWGQVRDYKLIQKFLYTVTGKIGMGSLLVGLAQQEL